MKSKRERESWTYTVYSSKKGEREIKTTTTKNRETRRGISTTPKSIEKN